MITRHRCAAALLVLTIGTLSTACHTMRRIELTPLDSPKPFAKIEIGDLVALETKDGRRHRFEVRGIEGDTLVSDAGTRYPRSEIARLEHEALDASKTVGLTAAITAASIVLLKVLESFNFFGT